MKTIPKNKKATPLGQGLILMVVFNLSLTIILSSCEEFVEIDPPRTDLIKSTIFASDATANAAMIDIYYQMSLTGFASGSQSSISYATSLSSDELKNYSTQRNQEFNDNTLTVNNEMILGLWSDMYKSIYTANAILEGLSASSNVSENLKKQLEGEAKFIRAFCHFYLVNLWGDTPLVLSTNYQENASIPRTDKAQVYQQIITDLKDAQNLLPDNYSFSNNERVRTNKGVATALLSRAYLYVEDWTNAEIQATSVINNTATYNLVTELTKVFTKNNTEAIWQFHNTFYPNDIFVFYVFSTPPNTCALRDGFENSFETGDQRRTYWIGSITDGTNTYYFPKKYQSFVSTDEYSTVFRLAEQFLIRAEARAQLNDISGAQADINAIRRRAGLGDTPANDKTSLLEAIEQERKVELFTEHGHRWLDLKRTERADAVLAPIKGGNWKATDVLYPIPEYQILNDLAMKNAQNPGY